MHNGLDIAEVGIKKPWFKYSTKADGSTTFVILCQPFGKTLLAVRCVIYWASPIFQPIQH